MGGGGLAHSLTIWLHALIDKYELIPWIYGYTRWIKIVILGCVNQLLAWFVLYNIPKIAQFQLGLAWDTVTTSWG